MIDIWTVCLLAFCAGNDRTVSIAVTLDAPAKNVTINIAPLRYHKSFACSFTLDDGLVSAARVAFPFFNGGQVAPSFKDHWGADQGGDGAHYPGLFYTDGCGNNLPFTAAVAINARAIGTFTGYLSWNDLERMTRAGWDVLNHSYTHATGKDVQAAWEVEENTRTVQQRLHTGMQQFVIPGGKDSDLSLPLYTDAAFAQGLHAVHCGNFTSHWMEPAASAHWDSLRVGRLFLHNKMKNDVLKEIDQHLETGKHYWLNIFTHSVGNDDLWNISFPFNDFSAFFNRLAAVYGRDGKDNIWFAPPEAVHVYEALRRAVKPAIKRNGNKLLITFDAPQPEKHRALTFMVQGGAAITAVSGKNCSIESYGGTKQIINITW
jgi:hypothetical protein